MACEYSGMLDELLNRPTGELWLFGSDGKADDDDAGSDDDDDNSEDDDDDDEGDDDGDNKSKKGASKPKLTAAEIAALQHRVANIDDERDRDKAKLKKATDSITELKTEITRLKKDGVKDEEVKQRNTELEGENSKLQEQLNTLRIQLAFVADTTYKWVDPAAAAKLLDLSNVEIDDKGRVTGLKTALDELAEKSKYLLVQPSKDDDADGDDDQQERKPRKTGDQPGNQRKTGSRSQQARDAKLATRFSALRR